MFGRVPAYTDISHFRAPYENVVISGFGQEVPPAPPAPPPPPTAAPNGLTEEAIIDVSPAGIRRLKPSIQKLIDDTLMGAYGAIHIGGQFNNVQLVPFTPEEMQLASTDPTAATVLRSRSAGTWCAQQVKAGNVVFMSMTTAVALMSGQPLPPGADQLGTFPSGSDQAIAAAKSPLGVVLKGDPGGEVAIAGLGVGLIVAGVLVVGGLAFMAMRKKGGPGGMRMPTTL